MALRQRVAETIRRIAPATSSVPVVTATPRLAEPSSAACSASAPRSGRAEASSTSAPATCGEAIDVPVRIS